MLTNYLNKLGISLPSANLYLNKKEFTCGSAINGHVEIKGRFIKNVLKRYEIELIREERDNNKEELINSSSIYCSKECLPNKKDILPFILNIPEDVRSHSNQYTYSIVVRTVWENSQTVQKKQPLVIQ